VKAPSGPEPDHPALVRKRRADAHQSSQVEKASVSLAPLPHSKGEPAEEARLQLSEEAGPHKAGGPLSSGYHRLREAWGKGG
jgi:hypothetical protein